MVKARRGEFHDVEPTLKSRKLPWLGRDMNKRMRDVTEAAASVLRVTSRHTVSGTLFRTCGVSCRGREGKHHAGDSMLSGICGRVCLRLIV